MPPIVLCSFQPHPTRFVWSFLFGGIVRTHNTLAARSGRTDTVRTFAPLVAELAACDVASFYMFKWLVSQLWATTLGVAVAWITSLALAYPLRAWAAMRARQSYYSQGHSLPLAGCTNTNDGATPAILTTAAVASTLVVVLFTATLKLELQERGAAIDAACYAWHIATFYLGVGFAPALHRREHRHDDDDERDDHSANGQASPLPSSPHTLALAVMASPSAAAPFAASAVAVGALGVLPSNCCHQCHAQNAPWRSWVRRPGTHLYLTAAALAAYVVRARLAVAPEAVAGPFVSPCGGRDEIDTEVLPIGRGVGSLLGLMYGHRTLLIPPLCEGTAEKHAERETPSASSPDGIGIVLAADGSQGKYADAVYVALHNIRSLHRSAMPAEVMHVGEEERFGEASAARLVALGGVTVVDMLQRLHPAIRRTAALRLRSFAAKPFAMLASRFEQVLLIDANALFFSAPETLLQLRSYRRRGVQLFTDYVRAYHIVDPWLISGYLGSGAADVEEYRTITQGAECDSSVVVVDKRKAWRYLHVVAALNWWKAILDRHTWGDKDTWALAAIALGSADGAAGSSYASVDGSRVGWLTRTTTQPPSAVWGHMQFDASRNASDSSALLYINWQPHYAAGFLGMDASTPPGADVACCVLLHDHWEGPHDEEALWPTIDGESHAGTLRRTLADARDALAHIGAPSPHPPHWWGQVRYRRCFIYFGVLASGMTFTAVAVWHGIFNGRPSSTWPQTADAPNV